MNLFAVNAAEVNGSIEVWSWYGDAVVAVSANGELRLGLTLSGDAYVVTAGELLPRVDVHGEGSPAVIVAGATGEAIRGTTSPGSAQVVVGASGDGTRWTFGESAMDVVFVLDGEGQVVQPAAASFTIVMSTSLDGTVAGTVIEEGLGQIILDGSLESKTARTHRGEGVAEIHAASIGSGYLIIDGPPADASVLLTAEGDARLGGKVYGEGSAAIELFARGSISSLHYEYGEGEAVIAIMAAALPAGIPPIPSDYVPAPSARTITVQRGDRELDVPRQDRRIA